MAVTYSTNALGAVLLHKHNALRVTCEKINAKNSAGPNEFIDFEQFGLEHPDRTKTIFATNWANHPGDGINRHT